MHYSKMLAEASASVLKSICLVAAIVVTVGCGSATACFASPCFTTNAARTIVLTVTPLASWQSQHPDCKVSAVVDQCGNLPTAVITGEDCFPSSGTVNVAQVVVQDDESNCETHYLIRAVDGSVQVVVIDP
ncbi:MAG: hypothetical protein RLZZ519_2975 [Bacteroidota bacterium]|jgi:hypothetical protein